jgi:hypothetical protein
MIMVDVGPICSTHSYMLVKERREELDDLLEYRKLEQEARVGKVSDCNHAGCHSSMGSGACLRHHIAYLQWKVTESEKWAKRYKWLADHPKEKG